MKEMHLTTSAYIDAALTKESSIVYLECICHFCLYLWETDI